MKKFFSIFALVFLLFANCYVCYDVHSYAVQRQQTARRIQRPRVIHNKNGIPQQKGGA